MQEVGGRTGDSVKPVVFGVEIRHCRKQAPGIRVAGIIENIVDAALFHNLAGIHYVDIVSHLSHHAQIVGDINDGNAHFSLDFLD